jgi:Protein of unknown function (DUF2637)
MNTPNNGRPRGQRAEGVVQVLILLAIGTTAAAASFTHVHNVAAAHGQPGWLAWADAIVLELMSIACGLEIRRRHRAAQPAGFVLGILAAAVTLSLSAQVVEAERSVVGWLAAALPALGFLASVKIVLTRIPAIVPAESDPLRHNDTTSAPPVVGVVEDQGVTAEPAVSQTGTVEPPPVRRPALVPVAPDAFSRVNGSAGAAR